MCILHIVKYEVVTDQAGILLQLRLDKYGTGILRILSLTRSLCCKGHLLTVLYVTKNIIAKYQVRG